MPAVSNTSPLIWLSKIGRITLLKELFHEVIIPDEVYKEAVERGLHEGFSDALVLKEAVDDGWIKTSKLTKREVALCRKITRHAFEIHLGEAQAIILARRINLLFLIDESSGRALAEAWGLKAKGTVYVILIALRSGFMNSTEAKETVISLVVKGFRIEPSLLARIIREIENFNPKSKNP